MITIDIDEIKKCVRDAYCINCKTSGWCNVEDICDGFKKEVEEVKKEWEKEEQ